MAFVVAQDTEGRVGKPHAAVGVDHHVVGRVQRLAVELVDQHGDAAVVPGAHYAAAPVLAADQAALAVASCAAEWVSPSVFVGHPFRIRVCVGYIVRLSYGTCRTGCCALGHALCCPPSEPPADTPSGGFYVAPTIITDLPASSAVWREEIFGPVLAVTVFDTEDEALRIANDTEYGMFVSKCECAEQVPVDPAQDRVVCRHSKVVAHARIVSERLGTSQINNPSPG